MLIMSRNRKPEEPRTFTYTFYKILSNGNKKAVHYTDSTLDPEYHAYINWCRENNMRWQMVRNFDNKVMWEG